MPQILLVEFNTLPLQQQFSLATIQAAHRASQLSTRHPTRTMIEEQFDLKLNRSVQRREPLAHRAHKLLTSLNISPTAEAKDGSTRLKGKLQLKLEATAALMTQHQKSWTESGSGKLLQSLITPDRKLPEYLFSDTKQVASIRSKLRFGRCTLAQQLFDRDKSGELKLDPRCTSCGKAETIEHMVCFCKRFNPQRIAMCGEARNAQLPQRPDIITAWTLGDLRKISLEQRSQALTISAEFLRSINSVWPL